MQTCRRPVCWGKRGSATSPQQLVLATVTVHTVWPCQAAAKTAAMAARCVILMAAVLSVMQCIAYLSCAVHDQ